MNRYEFAFTWDSTYGIAARMLHDVSGPGIVVDLGCGEGTFARPVIEFGRGYLGVELDQGSVERCRAAGLDVHHVDLADPDTDTVHDRIVELVAGRPVAAVSMLDVIEHLVDPRRVLADLARLLSRLDGPSLVVSIPNVTHIDIASKLLFGRWDLTRTGLLDDTHVTFFDDAHLQRAMTAAGFAELDRRDKQMTVSEQAFPQDHPAISRHTNVRRFFESVRGAADDHRDTYQFVRAYRHDGTTFDVAPPPDELAGLPATPTITSSSTTTTTTTGVGGTVPFCSVVVRTQGARASLDDALVCLAAQTDRDIEVLVVVHHDAPDVVDGARELVARYAPAFADRVRVIPLAGGGRAAPLNAALTASRGRYIAFLDDDDIVTANWIEEYRAAAADGPGTVLRSQCAVQEHRRTNGALIDYEPTGGFDAPFNPEFDFMQHRQLNQTPICSWAIPSGAVAALGLEFDDELPVCEDWEFLARATSLLGVTNRGAFTSVYRRFTDGWGSMTTVDQRVWDDTAALIMHRLDAQPNLVPAGSIVDVAIVRQEYAALSLAHEHALARIQAFERSRYWRVLAPLRWLTAKRGSTISELKQRWNARGRR